VPAEALAEFPPAWIERGRAVLAAVVLAWQGFRCCGYALATCPGARYGLLSCFRLDSSPSRHARLWRRNRCRLRASPRLCMAVSCGRTPYAPYSSHRLGCSRSPPFVADGPHVQTVNKAPKAGVRPQYRAVSTIRIDSRPTRRFCQVGRARLHYLLGGSSLTDSGRMFRQPAVTCNHEEHSHLVPKPRAAWRQGLCLLRSEFRRKIQHVRGHHVEIVGVGLIRFAHGSEFVGPMDEAGA